MQGRPASDSAYAAWTDLSWMSKDGLKLHARDFDPAPGPAKLPVICIHGLTRNARDFDEVASRIARTGRRVIAVDVRGRGDSAVSPDPMKYRPDVYAKDMVALLDQTGIKEAIFIGTSMGGLIMMVMAATASKRIAAAVLNDVGPALDRKGLERIAAYAGKAPTIETWADALAWVKHVGVASFPDYTDDEWETMARRMYVVDAAGKPKALYDPAIMVPIRKAKLKSSSLILRFLFRRLARKRPCLLIRGAISDLLTAELAAGMKKSAPDLTIAEVPRVGHAPMLTEPAAVAALDDFLAKLP